MKDRLASDVRSLEQGCFARERLAVRKLLFRRRLARDGGRCPVSGNTGRDTSRSANCPGTCSPSVKEV